MLRQFHRLNWQARLCHEGVDDPPSQCKKVGLPSPPSLPLPPQLLVSCCCRRLTLQRLPATRSMSSSCSLPSLPWTLCLTPPQGQRRRERRPHLWLLLRPQPMTHRLQHQHNLPPPPQRKARQPTRRSPPSPLTFGLLDYIAYSGEYTGAFSFSSKNLNNS
jgi:hypothetical protein